MSTELTYSSSIGLDGAGQPLVSQVRRLVVNTIECTLRGIDAEFQTRQAAPRVGAFRAVRRELCDLLAQARLSTTRKGKASAGNPHKGEGRHSPGKDRQRKPASKRALRQMQ